MGDRRKVGWPEGETTYTEFCYRKRMPDGTIVDTEPRRAATGEGLAAASRSMGKAFAKKVGAVRMERTVTVTAGEWREVETGDGDDRG